MLEFILPVLADDVLSPPWPGVGCRVGGGGGAVPSRSVKNSTQ